MDKRNLQIRKELWLKAEKNDEKAPATLKSYDNAISRFLEFIPNQELTKDIMIDYKMHLIDTHKASSVNNQIVILNKFIKFCEVGNLSDVKNTKSDLTLKKIKIQKKASIEDVLTRAELNRLLRNAKEMDDMEMYYIMRVLSETGIRISELKYFTAENIESSYISVRNKGKTRDIILNDGLRRELKRYCRTNEIKEGTIFELTGRQIRYRMQLIASKSRGIKLSKVHPHAFRHFFACEYIAKIGDLVETCDILGHTSMDTTAIYCQSTMEQKKKHLNSMFRHHRENA